MILTVISLPTLNLYQETDAASGGYVNVPEHMVRKAGLMSFSWINCKLLFKMKKHPLRMRLLAKS